MAIFIEEKSEVGKIIWSKLKEIDKTQKWLATEVKCTPINLVKICDGSIKNPSFLTMIKISKKLNISVDELLEAMQKDRISE